MRGRFVSVAGRQGPEQRAPTVMPLRRVAAAAVTAILVAGAACGLLEREDEVPEREIEEVLEEHTPRWMELPGVVGTGAGECDGEPCIRVFLSAPSPEAEAALPDSVEGYPVQVVVTGPFRPR